MTFLNLERRWRRASDADAAAAPEEDSYWVKRVHPELKALARAMPPDLTFDDPDTIQAIHEAVCRPGPTEPGVASREVEGVGTYYFPSSDGDVAGEGVARTPPSPAAAVLWVHGGGRILGCSNGANESKLCSRIANIFSVPVLSVQHRLPPSDPFPAPLDDVHGAYRWLVRHVESGKENAGTYGGPARVAVAGEGAGAGLAAELCQRLLDEGRRAGAARDAVPLPVCQLLLCPMLDDRTCLDASLSALPPHIVWNAKSNAYAWSSYLGPGREPGDDVLPEYAAAGRRADLSGLPPAYVQVGSEELFRAECADYARRLWEAGVDVEFDRTEGAFHDVVALGKEEGPVVGVWERIKAFGERHLFA